MVAIQIRRDTEANWRAATSASLAGGEYGLNITNKGIKIGAGTGTTLQLWSSLPYVNTLSNQLDIDSTVTLTTGQVLLYDSTKAIADKSAAGYPGKPWVPTALSTTIVSEGDNLYFTSDRAKDAVGGMLTDTSSIDFTYNSETKVATADVLVDSTKALTIDATAGVQVVADATKGLTIDETDGLQVLADSAKGLTIDATTGLQVVVDTDTGLLIDATTGIQIVVDGSTIKVGEDGLYADFTSVDLLPAGTADAQMLIYNDTTDGWDVLAAPSAAGLALVSGTGGTSVSWAALDGGGA